MENATKPALELAVVPVELTKAIEGTALTVEGRATLRDAFAPHFTRFHEVAEAAKQVAVNNPNEARTQRLALKAVRVACEKTRKALKDDVLVRGRAIDSINAILETQITPLETQLENIEKAEERAEAKRKADLKLARETLLKPYGLNTNFIDLSAMPEEEFVKLHENTRLAHEAQVAKAAKEEADRAAKAAADAEEAARVKAENERLKKEAAEREAAAKVERERVAAEAAAAKKKADEEAAAAAEVARKEREEIQRKADEAAAAAKKQQDELQAKLDAERKERERVEAENARKAKEEADRIEAERVKAAADLAIQRENERKAAAAPDREKLHAWVGTLRDLTLPETLSTHSADLLANEIDRRRIDLADWAYNQIQKL